MGAAKTLVDRCVAGEADAWRELHRAHYAVVRTFLRRMGVRDPEVDDATQEVFLQVFRSLARFEGRAELRTWLYRLCVTQAGRVRRRAFWRRALPWTTAPEKAADPAWSEPDMHRLIGDALTRMKPRHREVFVLFELEGLPGEEIAQVLACPVATVWRRLHYARAEFEALITGDDERTRP